MGLRINTNAATSTALRTLRSADRDLSKSLERLSTGLRINSASDDPSGLVISEQLRNQISGLRQSIDNSQNASNLVGTAEAALNEVHSLLLGIRESVLFSLNTGGNDAEQIDAEQDSIDNAIRSIDRIASTTKFGSRNLLNGGSEIQVLSSASGISELNLQKVAFAGQSQQQFSVTVTAVASQATELVGNDRYGGASSAATVRISGSSGTQDIQVASSFTTTQFDNAVNLYTADTGIWASAGQLFSVDFGTSESISVEVVSGTLNTVVGNLQSTDGIQSDDGVDIAGHVNGVSFDGDGTEVRVVSDVITGTINFSDSNASITAGSTHTFTVDDSGLKFQLNQTAGPASREQIGVGSVDSSNLGVAERSVNGMAGNSITIGGFLSSLVSGNANDLNSNAANALGILDAAIEDISDTRSYLGAFQSHTVDTNLNSLEVALEQLSQAESTIRDLDFAQETANYTKNQVLFQASISVLAQANQIPQAVLSLIT